MGVPYAEVIGDPIAHSKSPAIHKFWLNKLGIEGDYRAVRVRAEALPAYFQSRRFDPDWQGCNVTMPHKTGIAAHLDAMTDAADRAGAVNCVARGGSALVGSNTDIAGIEAALCRLLSAMRACVIGTGGAARAAVATLSSHGIGDIRIVSRRPAGGHTLGNTLPPLKFFGPGEIDNAMAGAEIVINATPLGMTGQPAMPHRTLSALACAHPDAYVLDMVYAPVETPFLRTARRLGFGWSDGLQLLIGQAREAFRLLFGVRAPLEHDDELRKLLTS